jgi:hypothetical protein
MPDACSIFLYCIMVGLLLAQKPGVWDPKSDHSPESESHQNRMNGTDMYGRQTWHQIVANSIIGALMLVGGKVFLFVGEGILSITENPISRTAIHVSTYDATVIEEAVLACIWAFVAGLIGGICFRGGGERYFWLGVFALLWLGPMIFSMFFWEWIPCDYPLEPPPPFGNVPSLRHVPPLSNMSPRCKLNWDLLIVAALWAGLCPALISGGGFVGTKLQGSRRS